MAEELNTLGVIYIAPREVLRLSGALGPLQASAVAGTLTWKLTGGADNTRMQLRTASGDLSTADSTRLRPP
jgi:hypothetical protein